jgi:hypothetical protein
VVALSASYRPTDPDHGARKALVKEGFEATMTLDRLSSSKVPNATSGHDSSAGPSIQALSPQKGLT